MKISTVLASYNGEKYIIEQLRSILNQTKAVDEVIITDDRSTDETEKLVCSFLSEHKLSSWKFTVNERNLGFAENFRKAIDMATGDLIFLCDQDDIWVGDRVERMTAIMEAHPEIGLLNTDYASFKDGSDDLSDYYEGCSGTPERIPLNKKNFFLRYPGCVMCLRKSFYDEVQSEWYEGWAHDEFFWNMAMLHGCCYSLRYCSLKRRFHENQTSGRVGHSKEKRIRYLQGIQKSSMQLLGLAKDPAQQRLYRKMQTAHRYRLELVRDRTYCRAFQLPFYLGYYHSKKSYFVELALALKGGL